MKVRVVYIHPEKGLGDATIHNVSSIDEVVTGLKNIGCKILTAEEEVSK